MKAHFAALLTLSSLTLLSTAASADPGCLTDLGTLGGDSSEAFFVSESGWIGGYSQNAGGQWRAVIWDESGIFDLGTLGGSESYPMHFNQLGEIVGQAAHAGDTAWTGFYWSADTGMIDMGTLGMDIVYPLDINANGEVVGHAYTAAGEYHAFYWSLSTGMLDLGTLGGANSAAEHINDDGVITGYAQRTDGKCAGVVWEGGTMTELHQYAQDQVTVPLLGQSGLVVQFDRPAATPPIGAFAWDGGVFTALGSLGGGKTQPTVIGSGDVVVGSSYTSAARQHPFRWTATSGMVDLGTLGGLNAAAYLVSGGRIAGYSETASGDVHAFVHQSGSMVDLGTLGGSYSYSQFMNAGGLITGFSATTDDAGEHTFAWKDGDMIDLGTFGGDYTYPWHMSEQGDIVGISYLGPDETHHAFVCHPF